MTTKAHFDVIIVGGGMVGLTLAALLSKNNFSVAIVESQNSSDPNELTARVSAIHTSAIHLFHYLDCWKLLSSQATCALEKMTVWDHTNNAFLNFDSSDIDQTEIGFIIENRAVVKMLQDYLYQQSNVTFFSPNTPISLEQSDKVTLTLNTGEIIFAEVIVGADGARSWVREQTTIKLQSRPYYHKAITAVIASQHPHDHCAYQKFLKTGPVALLPLANPHHTALVWSADIATSDTLLRDTPILFARTLTDSLDYKLGELALLSDRSQFTLTMQHVDQYAENRVILIGDAAHTIHPLAGLGVNLGLIDAAYLTQLLIDARTHKKSLADYSLLRKYTRIRKSDNSDIVFAMRTIKDFFAMDNVIINLTRSAGVNFIDQSNWLKKYLMSLAMEKSTQKLDFLNK